MKTALFLKTWKNDLHWLPYLFRSIDKFCTGFDEFIIVADSDCKDDFEKLTIPNSLNVGVFFRDIPEGKDGYIDQQVVKMRAFEYTDCDVIFYTDSDCIFYKPTKPSDYFVDGKIRILKTPYSELGASVPWQIPTEKYMSRKVYFEYMRRNELLYFRKTVKALHEFIEPMEQSFYLITDRRLSEFNLLGAFAEIYEPEYYYFLDTSKEPLPETRVIQKWSWGGLTDEVKAELENYLL